jgi:hypothetical protein
VRVILDLLNPPPPGLGHDYRVDVAITTWKGADVLRAPSRALFRVSDRWCAFAIRDGRARLVNLETGASDANWTSTESRVAKRLERIKAELALSQANESAARRLTESLAVLLQGALLIQHGPSAIAEAYCCARLSEPGFSSYGTLEPGIDIELLLERAACS